MNYIVFDLEWNQCPYGKYREVERLPFEIIEIGAVKLNKEKQILDRFYEVVRPVVYPVLHYRTREIVHLSRREMQQGLLFPEALEKFLDWAGPDPYFAVWGSVDLPELQRNMEYYGLLHLLKGPLHYLDVQKLFAAQFENLKERRALEYASNYLGLELDGEFHNALSDADYTARILTHIDDSVIWAYDSMDVYQNPLKKEDEIHAVYNGCSKYISREFSDKEAAMENEEVKSTYCCVCGKKARKKVHWFSVNGKSYYAAAFCPEHGYMKGKIRMQHGRNGGVFVIKTLKQGSEAEIGQVLEKKDALKQKRRQQRYNKKHGRS